MSNYKPKRGIWQAEVFSRVDELQCRLDAARGDRGTAATGEEKAIFQSVEGTLGVAKQAAGPGRLGSRLKAWWSGSAITEAWESVHHAELALLKVEKEGDVKAVLARLLAWILSAMEDPERRGRHETVLKEQVEGKRFDRIQVRSAFADVIAANRERYANLRIFRNILILVNALLALLVIGAAVWHALNPGFLTLCPSGSTSCLSGPPKTEVAVVALLGALGGSLAFAFGLAQTETTPSRYDPKLLQASLKPVTGAVTGLLGVVLIQAEFLIKPVGETSYSLLVYAVLFGFSQQLFTRMVDKKAEALTTSAAKSSPQKDP